MNVCAVSGIWRKLTKEMTCEQRSEGSDKRTVRILGGPERWLSTPCCPCKYGDPSSVPQNLCKKVGCKGVVIPVLRRQRKMDPWGSLVQAVQATWQALAGKRGIKGGGASKMA